MAKAFWDKKTPADSKGKDMTPKQVKSAKASAKAAGRPYPNLVDNVKAMHASRKKGRG